MLSRISLAVLMFLVGCENSNHNPQNVGGASVVAASSTVAASPEPTPSHVEAPEPVTPAPSSQNQSTNNLALYQVDDWVVGASQFWEPKSPPLPQVKLFLINKEKELIFSLLVEEVNSTPEEYVNSQVQFLKKLNLANTTVKKTTINDINYSLIESPASNFNNWQWVLVQDKTAYVWSCGGPKDSKVNFESCFTVMTTVQK